MSDLPSVASQSISISRSASSRSASEAERTSEVSGADGDDDDRFATQDHEGHGESRPSSNRQNSFFCHKTKYVDI